MSSSFVRIARQLQLPQFAQQELAAAAAAQQEEKLLAKLRDQFLATGQECPLVVYDVDELMHPLIYTVADDLGIDATRCTATFSIRDNTQLTLEERDSIMAAFADPKYFRDIKFFPGVAEVLRPQQVGGKVELNTNSFTEEVAELKKEQLLAAIPRLKPEKIRSNVINSGKAHSKKFDPRTTILADDSPFNVRLSPALINLMPYWLAWTRDPVARQLMSDKIVIWRDSLSAINDFIYRAVEMMMTPMRS